MKVYTVTTGFDYEVCRGDVRVFYRLCDAQAFTLKTYSANVLALDECYPCVSTIYDWVRIEEMQVEGEPYPDVQPYYTVVIPWVDGPSRTEWHPTESTGPFSTLVRGVFASQADAVRWAQGRLNGTPYSVRLVDPMDGA